MCKKIIMYISAFIPMITIMWIKECMLIVIDATNGKTNWCALVNPYLIIELTVILAASVSLSILLIHNKNTATYTIAVKAVKNRSAEYFLQYYSLFILAMIGFSLTKLVDVIVLVLLLFVLGIVYIKNDLFFINPTINIFRSYIYEVEYDHGSTTESKLIISKEKLKDGEIIEIDISEFEFTFMRKKHESDN